MASGVFDIQGHILRSSQMQPATGVSPKTTLATATSPQGTPSASPGNPSGLEQSPSPEALPEGRGRARGRGQDRGRGRGGQARGRGRGRGRQQAVKSEGHAGHEGFSTASLANRKTTY